jgi:hypothetical protein
MFDWDIQSPGAHSCNDVTLGHWAYAICPGELVHLDLDALSVGATTIEITAVDLRDINRDPVEGVSFNGGLVEVNPETAIDGETHWGSRLSLFPNPFTEELSVGVSSFDGNRHVSVRVYDVSGRTVKEWSVAGAIARPIQLAWDGRDATGAPCRSGVYFVVAAGADWVARSRAVLLR